ncbi:tRNA1(Val) A37 N6-methylase TrmN6 [Ruminiclostridium sufflavum DSM 19573]|uniref:tRNA1(Val) A37 N6-methylase TrmN6 n=1 Tax=Ruminiclostridium sufflavum DSM 19573 TaxID=1121337 RepID=A0A318XRW8_9FIRM|nr:tRNA1(Val) (adenine(37)-N6)-methyltransferase [Ruminiclostridium sufflavum]PYG89194.1 tRNA1(Val) A37 N6-methylase TrmN6 [Ruminiclostridium sufflavum DSM 19573]
MVEINEKERIDDLQLKGLRLIQNTETFCFGVDAVLLSDFADVKKDCRVLDIGTGTGIIPVLLAGKTQAKAIAGLEIQGNMAEMANRSVILNGLEDRVQIIHGDIKRYSEYFSKSSFELVVSNPPYTNKGCGLVNPHDSKAVSRHEILCSLEDVVSSAAALLVSGGQLAMVHRPERLADIICSMRNNGIEPKYLRFVHPKPYKKPNMILIKGNRGGKPELKVQEPLYVYNQDGTYSDEINKIYGREVTEN